MNQPNSSLQAPNGQIPNTQQQQAQQQGQQGQQLQQQQVNLGHPNDVPNVNWRAEVSEVDRTRFVSQLSLALKHLSPATPDSETYNVASNFEAGLYQRCTSKNQYILAYAKKFQHIREQISQNNNGNMNNFQQQPQSMSPLAGNSIVNNAQSPQLQRSNFHSPLNLNQQQQQVMPTQNSPMRPQSNFHQQSMVQQGRPPQNQLQQQQQGTPTQSPAQTQAQVQAQAQAQMLAQQRSAAAAAMAMSNNPQLMQRPQQQQNQIPLNILQNMNSSNAAQAGLNISPQQFQMYFARQMALQQQQQQQQQQGQAQNAQNLQNQLLQQQLQQQNYLSHGNNNPNNLSLAQQQMLNMGMAAGGNVNKAMMGNNNSMPNNNPMNNNASFRPQQPQQTQTSQENTLNTNSNNNVSVSSPLQQNNAPVASAATTANFANPGSMSASSTPATAPVTLVSVQQQQKMQQQQQPFNPNMIRPPQPNSQQAQQMVNQELLMQRLQQQQQQQQQQHLMDGGMAGQRPSLQQTPQQFVQQGMYNQVQRPMMNLQQQMQMQQQNMGLKPLTSIQRNNAAAVVKQMDENVRQGRVRAPVMEGLSENEKMAIREQMNMMKSMYDKIDNLLPIFLAMTNNTEATRRLILMKYMFEDQWMALNHNKFLISLENLNKLREQFNGYFTWVRNAVGQQQQQHLLAGMNNGMQNTLMAQQQQQQQQQQQSPIGLGLSPLHMQQQQQGMSPQTMQGSPVVNYNMMNQSQQQNYMTQQGMMGMNPAQSQAQAFAMLQRQVQQQQNQQTPQQTHVQLPQQGQSPSLQNQQTPQQQQTQSEQLQQQENSSEPTTSSASTAPATAASVENTPVMSNSQVNMTTTPSAPSAGMKRGSIDLRLPVTKKQRGSKSSAPSLSPTLSRKNQKGADKEKTVGTPASAPASSTLAQQQPPQNPELTSLSASNSPAMINNPPPGGLSHPSLSNTNQQAMQINNATTSMENNSMGNSNFNMQYSGGIPVRAGMPLNQHQAQFQTFYVAAVSNGIPPQIVNLLPPKALQFNWFLQQAAQNKMSLSPHQQQQLQGMLNDHIEVAKQQLLQQSSSSPMTHNAMGRPNNVSMATPASILMNQSPRVSNNGFDMSPHQQMSLQQQLYQQHMQQQALQHHQMQQQLQHQKNQMQQQSMLQSQSSPAQVMQAQETLQENNGGNNSEETKVKKENEKDTAEVKQEKEDVTVGDSAKNNDNIPKSIKKEPQNPTGDENVMSSIYFSNVVLKDMSSMMDDMNQQEKNNSTMSLQNNHSPQLHMSPQEYQPQQSTQTQQQYRQQQNNNSNFDSFSSALKEGYKDETFGAPDLSLLTKPTALKEEETLVETGDLQPSWYDSAGGMDIGMDVFDWDNNDFVEFGDNDNSLTTNNNNSSSSADDAKNNEKSGGDTNNKSSKQDDKKLLDESNKAIAVSL